MSEHYVEIHEYTSGEAIKRLGPYDSERQAERADDGVNRNLDHEKFYTVVVPVTGVTAET